jgi:hypothetical protein
MFWPAIRACKRIHTDTVVLEQALMVMMLAIGPTAGSAAR